MKRTLKQQVADQIRGLCKAVNIDDGDVESIEVRPVSDLQTSLRVKTRTNGIHYYLVRVSEQL